MGLNEEIRAMLCDSNNLEEIFLIDGYERRYSGYCVENGNYYFLFMFIKDNIHTNFTITDNVEHNRVIQNNSVNCSVAMFTNNFSSNYLYGGWFAPHNTLSPGDCNSLNNIYSLKPIDKAIGQISQELT